MHKTHNVNQELIKLYELLEKTRIATLGADYQTRIQMREIRDKTIARIKTIKSSQQD